MKLSYTGMFFVLPMLHCCNGVNETAGVRCAFLLFGSIC